jgi:F5/8 type C domain
MTAWAVEQPRWQRVSAVFFIYLFVAAIYTHPLLELSGSRIAGDAGDPILNASILWWNATTVPFSQEWWNPPYFYPTTNVSAFTENLQGITPISSPVYWLTRNPLTAYNVALFLTWPLSAFAAFLLTRHLINRDDGAFLAGLAYGFSPYRMAELGHLQMVSSYWTPVALLTLHAFVEHRRGRWLALFAIAWLLQSFSNGYLMLFGGVLIGLWLLYFCSTRDSWRAVPAIVVTWMLASLPLIPVMLKYRAVHEQYGLRRSLVEPVGFSVGLPAWGEVSGMIWSWRHVFPDFGVNLFPGVTALVLVAVASAVAIRRQPSPRNPASLRWLRVGLAAMTIASLTLIVIIAARGPWRMTLGDVTVRLTDLDRAVGLAFWCGIPLLLLTHSTRHAILRRSPFLFYSIATLVMAALSCGPVLPSGGAVILEPMPYRWLMRLPGFNEVRVPARFWMLGVLCLAIAAGVGFATLKISTRFRRAAVFVLAACGIMFDGWLRELPMADPPRPWPKVERRDQPQPILELPLGPGWDAGGTFRSIWHRRPVVNGVSGYDPPHYAPLQSGLNDHDPAILAAIASLGSFDIVVDGSGDPDRAWAKYVAGAPGATLTATDGIRTAYRVPAAAAHETILGEPLPLASVEAWRYDAAPMLDGRIDTGWADGPQQPGQWVRIDLGRVREVGGITHGLGDAARDYPRLLAIDTSLDASSWEQAWIGRTAAAAFLGAIRSPRQADIHISFGARRARFVRLRQLDNHENVWLIVELKVHAPATNR